MTVSIHELGATTSSDATPLKDLIAGLSQTDVKYAGTRFEHVKSIPTVLLYDDKGLSIYDEITRVKEYYLYDAELNILKEHGLDIIRAMFHQSGESVQLKTKEAKQGANGHVNGYKETDERWGSYANGRHNYGVNGENCIAEEGNPDAVVVELGAGSLGKVTYILRALSEQLKSKSSTLRNATYYALDLEKEQLVQTLEQLVKTEGKYVSSEAGQDGKVHVQGLRSSYEEAFPSLKSGSLFGHSKETRRSLLWLGSSLGNFSREGARDFLRRLTDEAMRVGDTLLIGIDGSHDAKKIETAYNDPAGVTRSFILNGLDHADRVLGGKGILGADKFEYENRYNVELGAHEAFVRAKQAITVPSIDEDIHIAAGELLAIEKSYKFDPQDTFELFDHAGLRVVQTWTDATGDYKLHLVEKPIFHFEQKLGLASSGVPTLEEWDKLWLAWDAVTQQMIPDWMQDVAPIDLRHICRFYSGHIPVFLDIHLSRALKEPFTSPSDYTQIFERGIDPNVEDPTQIHAHSVVPTKLEDWPKMSEVLEYRSRVQQRLAQTYKLLPEAGKTSRRLARTVTMVFEHQALHLETLCYMLAQKSQEIRSPTGFALPQWDSLAKGWDDQVARDGKAAREAVVSFPSTTVTLGVHDLDTEDESKPYDPSHVFGWDDENGVRHEQVEAFRISSLPISNAQYFDFLKTQDFKPELVPSSWAALEGDHSYGVKVLPPPGVVSFHVGQHWPVLASPNQLAAYAKSKGGRLPTEGELRLFFDSEHSARPDSAHSNTGLQRWHLVPPSVPYKRRDGTIVGASNGGAWEATSTPFASYEGFSTSQLYPGYSSDFFDGHHSVVLGGSYLTIPRLCRSSVRNWYQFSYPYAFITGRIAFDGH